MLVAPLDFGSAADADAGCGLLFAAFVTDPLVVCVRIYIYILYVYLYIDCQLA